MTDTSSDNLYYCHWCGEEYPEEDMYETGYNHDPMCNECHAYEQWKAEQEYAKTGKRYVWVGDKRYPTNGE